MHISNQHKKCNLCPNINPSEKVLETHKISVHKKVQLKYTIESEPSYNNHKNNKYIKIIEYILGSYCNANYSRYTT